MAKGEEITFKSADLITGADGLPEFLVPYFEPVKEFVVKNKWVGKNKWVVDRELNDDLKKAIAELYVKEKNRFVAVSLPIVWPLHSQFKSLEKCNDSIMILGERGTGKEVVARFLHGHGPRKGGPFVEVNCASIQPELMNSILYGHKKGAFTGAFADATGLFSDADNGVLFLDEFHHLCRDAQANLLRAIEYKEIRSVGSKESKKTDVQIYAATNQPEEYFYDGDGFLSDLFERLNENIVRLPSLSERDENEKKVLATYFLLTAMETYKMKDLHLPSEIFKILWDTPYSGNIREMKNRIKAFVREFHYQESFVMPFERFFMDLSPATKENLKRAGKEGLTPKDKIERARRNIDRIVKKTYPDHIPLAESPIAKSPSDEARLLSIYEMPFKKAMKQQMKEYLSYHDKKQGGLNNKELAKIVGISASTVGRWRH